MAFGKFASEKLGMDWSFDCVSLTKEPVDGNIKDYCYVVTWTLLGGEIGCYGSTGFFGCKCTVDIAIHKDVALIVSCKQSPQILLSRNADNSSGRLAVSPHLRLLAESITCAVTC